MISNKYNKIKGILRDMYSMSLPVTPPSSPSKSKSPVLKYSIPIYEIYEDEKDTKILFKPKKEDEFEIDSSSNNLSPYINNNKVIVEIIILSYLFSSTMILGIIKHIFN